jgi:hypothetical protein
MVLIDKSFDLDSSGMWFDMRPEEKRAGRP